MIDYDAELRSHNHVLRRAYGIGLRDAVLDIGCGTGQTTRDAALMAREGHVLGVDISDAMIERARQLTPTDAPGTIEYQRGDAQTHAFPPALFDVAISRFGTMFFADPIAAFANIGRALRRHGRLVMMVWQAHDRNEWATSIRAALRDNETESASASTLASAFSLGDPDSTARILRSAGFEKPDFTDVQQPVHYGADGAEALDFVMQFSTVQQKLASLPPVGTQRCIERLRGTLDAHQGPDGVRFDSRAWIVTTTRA